MSFAIPLLKGRKHVADGHTSFVASVDAITPCAWACGECGAAYVVEIAADDCCTSKGLDHTAKNAARNILSGNIPVATMALQVLCLAKWPSPGLRALFCAFAEHIDPPPMARGDAPKKP